MEYNRTRVLTSKGGIALTLIKPKNMRLMLGGCMNKPLNTLPSVMLSAAFGQEYNAF